MDAVKEINELKFDMNNNFLLGVGETSFTVIDLRESQLEPDKHTLHNNRFPEKRMTFGTAENLLCFHVPLLKPITKHISTPTTNLLKTHITPI